MKPAMIKTLEPIGETGGAERPIGGEPALPVPRPGAKPELLAPAGDRTCLIAAVENGADAVYFGLERHNARIRARQLRWRRPAGGDGAVAPARGARVT